ncbi:MAG: hypothetical protein ACW96N_09050 [Candidatus Thorarchaeota archaeon]|jgi:hypothetical protein
MSYQFSDDLIGQIAKSLQIAILTGTDIIDHLRQIHVSPDENDRLVMTDDFREMFEEQLASMLEQLEEWNQLQEGGQAMTSWKDDGPVEE